MIAIGLYYHFAANVNPYLALSLLLSVVPGLSDCYETDAHRPMRTHKDSIAKETSQTTNTQLPSIQTASAVQQSLLLCEAALLCVSHTAQ